MYGIVRFRGTGRHRKTRCTHLLSDPSERSCYQKEHPVVDNCAPRRLDILAPKFSHISLRFSLNTPEAGPTRDSPINNGFINGLSNASTSKLDTFLVLHPRINFRLKKIQTSTSRPPLALISPQTLPLSSPRPIAASGTHQANPPSRHSKAPL